MVILRDCVCYKDKTRASALVPDTALQPLGSRAAPVFGQDQQVPASAQSADAGVSGTFWSRAGLS